MLAELVLAPHQPRFCHCLNLIKIEAHLEPITRMAWHARIKQDCETQHTRRCAPKVRPNYMLKHSNMITPCTCSHPHSKMSQACNSIQVPAWYSRQVSTFSAQTENKTTSLSNRWWSSRLALLQHVSAYLQTLLVHGMQRQIFRGALPTLVNACIHCSWKSRCLHIHKQRTCFWRVAM